MSPYEKGIFALDFGKRRLSLIIQVGPICRHRWLRKRRAEKDYTKDEKSIQYGHGDKDRNYVTTNQGMPLTTRNGVGSFPEPPGVFSPADTLI